MMEAGSESGSPELIIKMLSTCRALMHDTHRFRLGEVRTVKFGIVQPSASTGASDA